MLTIEKDIETYLTEQVKKLKGKCIKIPTVYEEGLPDRLVLLPGARMAFAELKRPKGGRLSDSQIYQHKILRRLGFKVYVPRTKEEVEVMLREVRTAQLPDIRDQEDT